MLNFEREEMRISLPHFHAVPHPPEKHDGSLSGSAGFSKVTGTSAPFPMLPRRRRALKYIDNRSEDKINHSNYASKTRAEEGR